MIAKIAEIERPELTTDQHWITLIGKIKTIDRGFTRMSADQKEV